MASSKIEWTDRTWNPITGCSKCSKGCDNCYAERFANRLKAMGSSRYENGFNVTVHRDLFDCPLKWSKFKMIFVNSMSDLFHPDVPEGDILDIFRVMNMASWHTFQILTKRADRLLSMSEKINWTGNIWMGVSIEDNRVIERCEKLKGTGAKIKFISAEPLLDSITDINLDEIDWLIVGGESGPKCRPMKEEWVLEPLDKARESGTTFFFKQWGGVRKKEGGNLLQGKYYKEYPIIL